MIKHLIVLLAVCLVAAATPAVLQSVPGEFWPSLAEMTPAERANCSIWLEPAPSSAPEAHEEARAISGLWNSGDFEAAIERARGYSRYGDPGAAALAVNPRELVRTDPGFGPDIRIGTRDSLYGCSFDRLHNGWLFASFPARAGDRTYIYSYRSTDNGATWEELAQLQWNRGDYVRATTAVCHGDYLVIAVAVQGTSANLGMTARISTTTGQYVNYPGDSLFVIAFLSNPDPAIAELAAASTEDGSPGSAVYLFGRTDSGALKYAWTDSSCRAWRVMYTSVTSGCDRSLDCTWNEGFDSCYVFASWLQDLPGVDSSKLRCGWWKTGNPEFQVQALDEYALQYIFPATAVTAWHDTVLVGYLQADGQRATLVYSPDCDSDRWYTASLSDTTGVEYTPEVCARRGGGFAAAYMKAVASDEWLLFRHADSVAGPYTGPDTVGECPPDARRRIRVENLGSGGYGVVWVTTSEGRYAAYYSRVNAIGIAELEPPGQLALGLRVLPRPGGVKLEFDNPVVGQVHIRVLDIAGRQVLHREERMGVGRRSIDLAPDASGVYFAVVEAAGRRACAGFTFVR